MTTPIGYPATFNVGTAATQIWGPLGTGATVTIINEDLTRPVFVGYRVGITAGSPDALTIPPLGAAAMDASRTAYIVSAEPGIVVQTLPGDAQWTPSPAQVSEQIAALGLATESTQQQVQANTAETISVVTTVNETLGTPAQNATVESVSTAVSVVNTTLGVPAQDATVGGVTTAVGTVKTTLGSPAQDGTVAGVTSILGSGIALPAGAAQDTTVVGVTTAVSGVTTTLGSPTQDDTLFNRLNLLLNGAFQNGSSANWSVTNATLAIVSTAPAGGSRKFSAQLTPTGTATTLQLNGGVFTATPGQEFQIRAVVRAVALSEGQTVNLQVNWKTGNTLVSVSTVPLILLAGNWYQAYGTVTAPAGVDHGSFIISETGATADIPATDILFVQDCSVHSQVAGQPAQDITVGGIPGGIAVAGVPLLSKSSSVLNMAATGIAGGASLVKGPFSINQIGYEFFIGVQAVSGSSSPFLSVLLTWSDSVSGLTVAQERWRLAGGSAVQQTYMGTGPTKGDTLLITYVNADAQTITVQSSLAVNSRVYVRDDWRQITTSAVPTFTNGTYDMQSNVLISTSPAVPASSSLQRLMALYAGLVNIMVTPVGSASVSIIMTGNSGLTDSRVYVSPTIAAGGVLNTQVNLPRGVCDVQLINNTASSNIVTFVATIAEQPA